MRAAAAVPPDNALLAQIDQLLGLNDGPVLAYDDPRKAVGKRVRIEDGRITAIRLAGETAARDWLKSLWQEQRADAELAFGQIDQIDQPDLAMKEECLAEQLHQKQEIQSGFFHSLRCTGQKITRRSTAL